MSAPQPAVQTPATPSIPVSPGIKAAILFEFGDVNDNKNPDVTVSAYGSVPFSKEKGMVRLAKFGPFDAPLEQSQAILSTVLAAAPLPAPAKAVLMGISAALFGILKIAL